MKPFLCVSKQQSNFLRKAWGSLFSHFCDLYWVSFPLGNQPKWQQSNDAPDWLRLGPLNQTLTSRLGLQGRCDGLGWVRCLPTAPNGSLRDCMAASRLGRWRAGQVRETRVTSNPFPAHTWLLAAWPSTGAVNGPCFLHPPTSQEWRHSQRWMSMRWSLKYLVVSTSLGLHHLICTSWVAGAVFCHHTPCTGEGTEWWQGTDRTPHRAGRHLLDSESGALSGIAGASWAGRGENGPTGMSQEGTKRTKWVKIG